jgi:hypothetical protein
MLLELEALQAQAKEFEKTEHVDTQIGHPVRNQDSKSPNSTLKIEKQYGP